MHRRGDRRKGRLIVALLLLGFFVPVGSAQRKPELTVPSGRWHVKNGNSTRTRWGIEDLRIDGLEVVWSQALEGSLATEMLSWDESFYALVRGVDSELRLKRFDLTDGALLAETPNWACAGEPGLTIWGRRILVTLPGVAVEGFSIDASGFVSEWRLEREADLASPILEGKELFLREGARVVRYDWLEEKPSWQSEAGYIGDFALSGDEILALWDGPEGLAMDVLDRDSGRRLSRFALPKLETREVGARPFVQGNGRRAAVRVPGTWVSESGRTQNTVVLRWPLLRSQPLQFEAYIHQVATPILASTDVYYLDDVGIEGGGFFGAREHRLMTLALSERNPELFLAAGSLNYTEGHFWCGGSVIRIRDMAIRRLETDARLYSAITALDTMLFRNESGDRVTALREPVASTRVPSAMDLADAQVVIEPDEVLEGQVVVEPDKGTVTCRDRTGTIVSRPIGRLLVVLDQDGLVRFTPSEVALLRGLRASGRSDFWTSCLELAADAARAGLAEDLSRYLNRAIAFGIDVRLLESLSESLRKLRESPAEIEPAAREKLMAKQDLHQQESADRYWRRLSKLFDEDFETGQGALRSWLKQYDQHPQAIEWVRSKIPEGLRPNGKLKPSDWLEFLIALQRAPVEVVDELPPRKSIPRSPVQKALEKARAEWREDLIGVKCGNLLILTPRQNPYRIANCLVVGQMVCGELERMFGSTRNTKRLLEIHLFESQEDFVNFGEKSGLGFIGMAAGFYSPQENISRLFVPSEEQLLYTVLDVLIHELTHHWMEACSPLGNDWKSFRLREGTGSFVVEGLATMLEELDYDAAKASVRSDSRRYWCLDFVANCPEHHLMPWKTILEGTQLDYARLMMTAKPIPDLEVPTTWHLLPKPEPNTATIYYAQVGALVTYLMQAEEGRHRDRVIDLVSRYYRGRTERLKIEKFMKLDAEELGTTIRAWAKEMVHPGR